MAECRPTFTPAVKESGKAVLTDEKSNSVNSEVRDFDNEPFSYRSAVGALLIGATTMGTGGDRSPQLFDPRDHQWVGPSQLLP